MTAHEMLAGALVDEHDPLVWCADCGRKLTATDGYEGLCRDCESELGEAGA